MSTRLLARHVPTGMFKTPGAGLPKGHNASQSDKHDKSENQCVFDGSQAALATQESKNFLHKMISHFVSFIRLSLRIFYRQSRAAMLCSLLENPIGHPLPFKTLG